MNYVDAVKRLRLDPFIKKAEEKLSKSKIPFSYNDYKLTGGAVIDIIEGRIPKDYDFLPLTERAEDHLVKTLNLCYVYTTNTATTYRLGGFTIQILKKHEFEFEFTISQGIYNIKTQKLKIDEVSFEKKILIPVSFDNKELVYSALYRIHHWRNKGYEISDVTYKSLLDKINVREKILTNLSS